VACIGEGRGAISFWWGNLMERGHLEDPGAGGRIILKWILERLGGGGVVYVDVDQDGDEWRVP
jgi:hypothetical protein